MDTPRLEHSLLISSQHGDITTIDKHLDIMTVAQQIVCHHIIIIYRSRFISSQKNMYLNISFCPPIKPMFIF